MHSRSTLKKSLLAIAIILAVPFSAGAQDVRANYGRSFAQAHCASCHAIGKIGESPLKTAPPFRELHNRYPVENLEESFAEGIVTGHPSMPEFRLDSARVGDLIAYLKTLEK